MWMDLGQSSPNTNCILKWVWKSLHHSGLSLSSTSYFTYSLSFPFSSVSLSLSLSLCLHLLAVMLLISSPYFFSFYPHSLFLFALCPSTSAPVPSLSLPRRHTYTQIILRLRTALATYCSRQAYSTAALYHNSRFSYDLRIKSSPWSKLIRRPLHKNQEDSIYALCKHFKSNLSLRRRLRKQDKALLSQMLSGKDNVSFFFIPNTCWFHAH